MKKKLEIMESGSLGVWGMYSRVSTVATTTFFNSSLTLEFERHRDTILADLVPRSTLFQSSKLVTARPDALLYIITNQTPRVPSGRQKQARWHLSGRIYSVSSISYKIWSSIPSAMTPWTCRRLYLPMPHYAHRRIAVPPAG